MSATNRGGARAALDFYATPAWVTEALLRKIKIVELGARVLDPCAGDGSILQHLGANSYGFELEGERQHACVEKKLSCHHRNSLNPEGWGSPDAVIMNPPYSLAMEFVERSLREVQPDGIVCALLRVGFLASKKRLAFHRAFPADVYILPRRPSFTPDGKTDASEYAWFVWPGEGRWFLLDLPEKEGRAA